MLILFTTIYEIITIYQLIIIIKNATHKYKTQLLFIFFITTNKIPCCDGFITLFLWYTDRMKRIRVVTMSAKEWHRNWAEGYFLGVNANYTTLNKVYYVVFTQQGYSHYLSNVG